MADQSERDRLQQVMQTHPKLAEAIAYLASLDARASSPPDGHRDRWDHELIASIVEEGSYVLDLGCGSGGLLERLRHEKGCTGLGVDRDERKVLRCVERGVPVLQADFDEPLEAVPDQHFDYVILETTLQTVGRPETVLNEMLRVGRVGLVSFPNYGHWWVRTQLLIEGRMPKTPRFPHTWYGTPDIHVLTIRDFETWCDAQQVQIQQRYSYADGEAHEMLAIDNVLAEEALFVITRNGRG